MINCIILEDELAAQEVLLHYIEKTPFMSCLGVYESGLDIPLNLLQETDLLFLDIQLPELNGLSFIKTIENPPKIIVTSAYSQYAIEAFELALFDYLVKPFSYERFCKSIIRLKNDSIQKDKNNNQALFIYADKTIYQIKINHIHYLKAEVDYVRFVTKHKQLLVYDSLYHWKEKLEPYPFIQIHRSYIINIQHIDKVYANQVYMYGQRLPIGKTFRNYFLEKLKSFSE